MAIRGSGAIFDGASSVLVFDGEKDQPKLVVHEKERNSGNTVEDFELIVEDHEGGVRVRATDIVPETPAEKNQKETLTNVEKIRAYLATHGFFTNVSQIREAIAASTTKTSAAIGEMLTSGELAKSGSHNSPRYHLAKNNP
jgi:hypothetical protein